jgi:putative endonuclease
VSKTTYQTGLAAEALCRFALRVKGYRILASRYKSRLGEIDIIAMRGKIVALVEVKARASKREAIESIHLRQRERLQRAASEFLARHPRFNDHNIRFDVMLVSPRSWPEHIADAWRP